MRAKGLHAKTCAEDHAGLRRIEEWSLAAWPALVEERLGGWRVRFSQGHTKRSNSVNPLAFPNIDLEQAVTACETLYEARCLPPIFRLSRLSRPQELDGFLAQRGYVAIDRTHVMCRPTDDEGMSEAARSRRQARTACETKIETLPLRDWLRVCHEIGLLDERTRALRERMIDHTAGERFPLVAARDGRPIGVNLGIRTGEGLGLFGLHVAAAHRRRGIGGELVADALRAGHAAGARTAYLQVEASNGPARCLYESFGFALAYNYWYRVRP